MAELYKHFSNGWKDCVTYTDEDLIELYNTESYGGRCKSTNGYYVGKKWLNVTVTMWKEDLRQGYLFRSELYNDPNYPHWWLDSILKDI
jgi:hypothetical protein